MVDAVHDHDVARFERVLTVVEHERQGALQEHVEVDRVGVVHGEVDAGRVVDDEPGHQPGPMPRSTGSPTPAGRWVAARRSLLRERDAEPGVVGIDLRNERRLLDHARATLGVDPGDDLAHTYLRLADDGPVTLSML